MNNDTKIIKKPKCRKDTDMNNKPKDNGNISKQVDEYVTNNKLDIIKSDKVPNISNYEQKMQKIYNG